MPTPDEAGKILLTLDLPPVSPPKLTVMGCPLLMYL